MKSDAFIQAHYNDNRVFYKFKGLTSLEHVIVKSLKIPEIKDIILVVPDCLKNRDIFSEISQRYEIKVFYGDFNNIARRFLDCSFKYNTEVIIRLPSVKPLFKSELVSSMVNIVQKNSSIDMVTVSSNYPRFFSPEVLKTSALKAIVNDFSLAKEAQFISSDPFFATEKCIPSKRIYIIKDGLPIINNEEITIARLLRKKQLRFGGDVLSAKEKVYEKNRYNFAGYYMNEDDNILDIACGDGLGCEIMSKIAKNGKIIGVDLQDSQEFKRIENANSNVKFIVTDVMKLELDQKFEKIVCFETIEHIERQQDFLLSLKDFLCDNGLLILSVPRGMNSVYLKQPLNPYHIKEPTANELTGLLSNCGFTIIKKYEQNYAGLVEENWSENANHLIAICQKNHQEDLFYE